MRWRTSALMLPLNFACRRLVKRCCGVLLTLVSTSTRGMGPWHRWRRIRFDNGLAEIGVAADANLVWKCRTIACSSLFAIYAYSPRICRTTSRTVAQWVAVCVRNDGAGGRQHTARRRQQDARHGEWPTLGNGRRRPGRTQVDRARPLDARSAGESNAA